MGAIERALSILSWQDNLPKKWMPPQWMWHLDEELIEHFDWVEEQRHQGPNDEDDDEEDESPSSSRRRMSTLEENEYAS